MSRLDAPLQAEKNGTVRAHLASLPAAVAERFEARGLEGSLRLAFQEPPPTGVEMVGRSHPLPATLAETLLEGALDPGSSPVAPLGRAGAWPTPAVNTVTTVALLRLRYKLTVHGRRERLLLAEEAGALAWDAGSTRVLLDAEPARALLEAAAATAPMPGHRVANSCCTPGRCPVILMMATRWAPSSKPLRGSRAARSSAPMSIRDTAATTPQTRVASSCQGKNAACSAASNASSDDASAIEAVIGHMKAEGHLGRCYLKGRAGDAANVILSAVGYNLRLVLAWLRTILRVVLLALFQTFAIRLALKLAF